jgi:uncharacterized membrane protein
MPSLDAKIAKRDPQHWPSYTQATSVIPFAAIAQRRNHFVFAEYGWWRLALALVLWYLIAGVHQWFFHIPVWTLLLH